MGSELLHEVMVRHPATVRIILSGQCDRQSVLKSVGPTHQFLTKPCDPATLKSTIAKIGTLRDQLPNQRMKQVVSRVQSIPSWRPAYEKFVAALESPAVSMNELGRIISRDVGLAAKILQLVNSGFFGIPQGVVDVTRAAAENSVFQTIRDDVGAYLMGLWGMPDPIVKAIAFHLKPGCCSDHAFSPLAAVHVANAIIEQESVDMPGLISPIDTEYLERIGCAGRLDAWTDICRAARQDAISLHTGAIA